MHQNCTALRGNISCGHNDATRRQQKPSRPTEDRQTEKERGRERKTGKNTADAGERESTIGGGDERRIKGTFNFELGLGSMPKLMLHIGGLIS